MRAAARLCARAALPARARQLRASSSWTLFRQLELRDEVERLSQRVDVLTEEKNQLLREAERAAEIKALFAGVSEKTREVQAAAASVIGQAEGRPRKGSAVGTPRERAVLMPRDALPARPATSAATGRGSRGGGGGGVGGVASRLRDAAAGKVGA